MIKVTALTQELQAPLFKLINEEYDQAEAQRVTEDIKNATSFNEILVCLDEQDNVIGFSMTTLLTKGFIRLEHIMVKKQLRRDKNASVILVAVMTRAVNRMTVGIFANCNKSNTDALAFFKARGFTVTGETDEQLNLTKSLIYMYKTEHHD